jgi:hypothetical protein
MSPAQGKPETPGHTLNAHEQGNPLTLASASALG